MIRAHRRTGEMGSSDRITPILRRLAAVVLLGLGGWWLVQHLPDLKAGRLAVGERALLVLLPLTTLACAGLLWTRIPPRRVVSVALHSLALWFCWYLVEAALGIAAGRSGFAGQQAVLVIALFIGGAALAFGRLLWRGVLPWQLPALFLLFFGGFFVTAGLAMGLQGLARGQFWTTLTAGTLAGGAPLVVGWLLWQHSRRQALLLAPSTGADFFVVGGTLRFDAPCYVERKADRELFTALCAGEFCYVLTSRQMGKSSLMVRTAARLREEGIAVSVLDLTALGQNLTVEQWYGGLLGLLGQSLSLEDELEAFWEERGGLGPLQRWTTALREVVLIRRSGRIIVFVDEIDVVRSLPFSTDEFFAAIRACCNQRSEEPELARLTFCLLGVATPSDLIQDSRTTPFNIGRRIELTDFAQAEVGPLSAGLLRKGRDVSGLMSQVLHWTGGHPYLTQRLCQAIADQPAVKDPSGVDQLCRNLFLAPGASDDNLQFVRDRLLKSSADVPGVLDLYGRVRGWGRVLEEPSSPHASHLRLCGITRSAGGYLQVRNRIYRHVFDRRWVLEHLPGAERRRQRAAVRRGLLVGAAATLFLVLIVLETTQLARHALTVARSAREAEQAAARAEAGLAMSYEGALMHLALNDLEGYRMACASTLARFGAVKRSQSANLVAWTCALGPDAVTDPNRPIALAAAAVASDPKEFTYTSTLGTCLYRAGRFGEAVQTLHTAVALQGKGGTAFEHLVLAMAHQRLGRSNEARQDLQTAAAWMRRNSPTPPRNGPKTWLAWTQHLELKLLRREAEALIQSPHGR
jgi:hypothetical protein